MTDSIPREEELVGEEGPEEGGDPAGEAEEGSEGAAEGGRQDEGADDVGQGPQAELEDLRDKHLRLVAEFNNFRRRTEQERLGAWARAQADLVAKFLDVLDDLNRVAQLDLSNATVDAIMEGIDLVERKFVRVLEDSGVEVIDPQDRAFDPELMEAVMRVTADSEEQDEQVAQVFQKGYSLKGILVRPARVSVYKDG